MPKQTDMKCLHVACVNVLQYVMHADQRCILYTCHSALKRKVTLQMAQVYDYVYIEERVFFFLVFAF